MILIYEQAQTCIGEIVYSIESRPIISMRVSEAVFISEPILVETDITIHATLDHSVAAF